MNAMHDDDLELEPMRFNFYGADRHRGWRKMGNGETVPAHPHEFCDEGRPFPDWPEACSYAMDLAKLWGMDVKVYASGNDRECEIVSED